MLWLRRRQEVVPALRAVAAEGDRSENAEYIYRKKQLGEMDRRIRYLSKRLDEVEVVHHAPARRDRVYFGARVRLEDPEGKSSEYRIVGADETSASRGWISVDSPMARALLGKSVDDEVSVALPEGRVELVQEAAPHIEEAAAAWAAQVLAAARRQQVAAEPRHVEVELAGRLAGVQQEGDNPPPGRSGRCPRPG